MFVDVSILVLAAMLGVIADRSYRRYVERRPRLDVHWSYHEQVGDVKGYGYTVSNVGIAALPDYNIVLFHPLRGSMTNFQTEAAGELHPYQQREHSCVVCKAGRFADSRLWFFHERDRPLDSVSDFSGFRFRLVMKNSEKILFESSEIGAGLARQFVRAFGGAHPGALSAEESFSLSHFHTSFSSRIKTACRRVGDPARRLIMKVGSRAGSITEKAT